MHVKSFCCFCCCCCCCYCCCNIKQAATTSATMRSRVIGSVIQCRPICPREVGVGLISVATYRHHIHIYKVHESKKWDLGNLACKWLLYDRKPKRWAWEERKDDLGISFFSPCHCLCVLLIYAKSPRKGIKLWPFCSERRSRDCVVLERQESLPEIMSRGDLQPPPSDRIFMACSEQYILYYAFFLYSYAVPCSLDVVMNACLCMSALQRHHHYYFLSSELFM